MKINSSRGVIHLAFSDRYDSSGIATLLNLMSVDRFLVKKEWLGAKLGVYEI